MPRRPVGFFGGSGGGGGGTPSINAQGNVTPGIAASNKSSGTVIQSEAIGVAVSGGPVSLLVPEVPGVGLSSTVSGSANLQAESVGIQVTSIANLGTASLGDGADIQQVTYNLTGTYGASSVTGSVVTGTNWTNITNASGVHNGTLSSHPGAVSAQDSYLNFTFPDFPNKDDLVISAATLNFYFAQGGTIVGNGNLKLYWGTDTATDAHLITTFTGNVSNLSGPYTVDLFAAGITTWTQLNTVAARIRGTLAAGATTVTQDVDAVELVVTASRTDVN